MERWQQNISLHDILKDRVTSGFILLRKMNSEKSLETSWKRGLLGCTWKAQCTLEKETTGSSREPRCPNEDTFTAGLSVGYMPASSPTWMQQEAGKSTRPWGKSNSTAGRSSPGKPGLDPQYPDGALSLSEVISQYSARSNP